MYVRAVFRPITIIIIEEGPFSLKAHPLTPCSTSKMQSCFTSFYVTLLASIEKNQAFLCSERHAHAFRKKGICVPK